MEHTKRVVWITWAVFIASVAYAGERLNEAELKEFYEGNTVSGVHKKRGMTHTYYNADGSVQSNGENGTKRSGKWWIEDGKRCVRWDHEAKDFCHYVERNEDGSHALIHGSKGKKVTDIRSRVRGNTL